MRVEKLTFKIASWSLIIVGVGHTITYLSSPKNAKQLEMIQSMKDFTTEMMGSKISIFDFHHGFSLIMGTLLTAYGLLNLFISQELKIIANRILILNMVVTLIASVLSIKYFFAVPIVLTSLAFVSFTISYLGQKTKKDSII